jgi:hypothetical protein
MGIPDRIYRIAKSHLDQALDRWEQIDSSAQKELDEAVQSPALSAFERAQAKINSAQAARGLRKPAAQEFTPLPPPGPPGTVPLAERLPALPSSPSSTETPIARMSPRPSNTMVDAAYQIIGVPAGSSFETVRQSYQKLKERASPDRFPAGSPDQVKARDIERRINAAYMTLMDALAPSEDRFDRLEF